MPSERGEFTVFAPCERCGHGTIGHGAVETDGGREARHVVRFEPLGLVQTASRKLRLPGSAPPAHAAGPGIEARLVDVESILVRLLAAKDRVLEREVSDLDAGAQDAGCDVRRVEEMVRERRLRIVTRRGAVHERRRPERRRADEIRADEIAAAIATAPIRRANSHEEIVRMLVVDDRHPFEALAGLKELRRAGRRDVQAAGVDELADGERLERQHAVNRQPPAAHLPLARAHEPVLGLPRREIGEQPFLVVETDEYIGVGRPRPA